MVIVFILVLAVFGGFRALAKTFMRMARENGWLAAASLKEVEING